MTTQERNDDDRSMVWIRDKDGKEYHCYTCDLQGSCDLKGKLKRGEEFTETDKTRCMDVSSFIGETRP